MNNWKEVISKVSGITDDSRKVEIGFLFVAIKGLTVDGHDYIQKAIEKGATVVVGEQNLDIKKVKYIKVQDSRIALGEIASEWYGNPSTKLSVIGVTGTDGKTTTTNLIYHLLKTSGKKVGMISTINAQIGTNEIDTGFHVTNPEVLDVHKYLNKMVSAGCEYAVIEVTSHGIDQKRIAGVTFDTGVLTNITHEHLDFHKTFENYRNTKLKLFKISKNCVLNKDDQSFDFFVDQLLDKNIVKYSLDDHTYSTDLSGIIVDGFSIKTLFGEYNVSNVLAAITTARLYQVKDNSIKIALENFPQLSGRLEKIENDKGITIFVDFAHTPNSLKNVLNFLKQYTRGKLIVVYGCASERDEEKRKLMPQVSIKLADLSIFTAEDPRKEDINQILDQMAQGAILAGGVENQNFLKIAERGEAIFKAIQNIAQPGDTVVICGKGHEKSMAYNGIEYPWSDQEAVRETLKGNIKTIPWKS